MHDIKITYPWSEEERKHRKIFTILQRRKMSTLNRLLEYEVMPLWTEHIKTLNFPNFPYRADYKRYWISSTKTTLWEKWIDDGAIQWGK